MEKLKIGVSGVSGRMGRLIAREVLEDSSLELAAAIEAKGHKTIGQRAGDVIGLKDRGPFIRDDASGAISLCRVFIEFTFPEPTQEHLFICRDNGVAMVIGTTALDKRTEDCIKEAASRIPIVYSPNMSTGVNVLFELVRDASKVLGKDFDIEIIETHHKHKKDKPSGTAKELARIIGEARGRELSSSAIHSLREGEVVGEHNVAFAGTGERIELVHRAESRRTFASGAVRAAKFLAQAKPGLYSMKEVLFGK